jgi:hypothetical protein
MPKPTTHCPKCGVEKSDATFYIKRRRTGRPHTQCKKCHRANMVAQKAARRISNPEAVATSDLKYLLKSQYRLSVEEFDRMHAEQLGRCAICEEQINRRTMVGLKSRKGTQRQRRAHVDHDHGTQQIRGLLCSWCNIGLANFRDNPRWLRKAAAYLEVKPFALFALEAA